MRKGIEHIKTFPYHPQANPAETFMKPLGKSMKSAYHRKADKEVALKQLLTSYRSTPHPATGESPGAIMLRSGYKTEFPHHQLSEESVTAAFQQDQHQKRERSHAINTTRHRTSSSPNIGDQVYVRNQRNSKFQPIFGPETYTLIDIDNGGAIIRNNLDMTTYRRHLDDIKSAPQSIEGDITWFPTGDNEPPAPVEQAPVFPIDNPAVVVPPPRRNPPRNAQPPAYLNDYVRLVTRV